MAAHLRKAIYSALVVDDRTDNSAIAGNCCEIGTNQRVAAIDRCFVVEKPSQWSTYMFGLLPDCIVTIAGYRANSLQLWGASPQISQQNAGIGRFDAEVSAKSLPDGEGDVDTGFN